MNMVLPGRAVEFDQAAMAADQILRDAESEAGAVGAAGDQRIENRVANLRGHARSVVLELDRGDQAMAVRADADIGGRARAQDQPRRSHAAARQRLQGIAAEVQHAPG